MTLPTNNDFANCELSTEDLEAIAAGWPHWMHTIAHAVESLPHLLHDHPVKSVVGGLAIDAAIVGIAVLAM